MCFRASVRAHAGHRETQLRGLQQQEIEVSIADLECQLEDTDRMFREAKMAVFGAGP